MPEQNTAAGKAVSLLLSWLIVGIPLIWGVWNTLLKLPALFK